jgi:hypothetical protein
MEEEEKSLINDKEEKSIINDKKEGINIKENNGIKNKIINFFDQILKKIININYKTGLKIYFSILLVINLFKPIDINNSNNNLSL